MLSAVSPGYSPSQNSTAAQNSAVLVADGIRMAFGGVVALDKVSISVGADELLAVIGPNGAGKTNLLEAISLLAPGRGLRRGAAGRPEPQAAADAHPEDECRARRCQDHPQAQTENTHAAAILPGETSLIRRKDRLAPR